MPSIRKLAFVVAATLVAGRAGAQIALETVRAAFAVDHQQAIVGTASATIEPAKTEPGHYWVRIYFFSSKTVPKGLRGWDAALQLTVADNSKIEQVNMSMPGRTCTIAWKASELAAFAKTYQFDGKHLRLVSAGSYMCDMKSLHLPDQKFSWDVDIDMPVLDIASGAR